MLKPVLCSLTHCNNVLKSFQEIAQRICDRHIDLLSSNKHFVALCWNCDRITGIFEVPRRLKGTLESKRLFSRKCSKCSTIHNAEEAWITIKSYESPFYWAIDEKGILVRVEARLERIDEQAISDKE